MPKSKSSKREKDELYWTVLNAAVTLDIRNGHLKWKISDLARLSRVSRPLLYYYFGKSKSAILFEAIRLFGDELAGTTPERQELWRSGNIHVTFAQSRELLRKIPAIVPFYFLNRESGSELGTEIRKYEAAFFAKVQAFFPSITKVEQKGLYALFFGILFAPASAQVDVSAGLQLVLRSLSGKPASR